MQEKATQHAPKAQADSIGKRRFWQEVGLCQEGGGFVLMLDGKRVRTPAGAALCVPCLALAEAIRDEWAAQGEAIAPQSMPMFKNAVTAVDRIAPQRAAVVGEMCNYGMHDLLCYREAGDAKLAKHQAETWQPYLDWLAETHGIGLKVFSGVMPGQQSRSAYTALKNRVEGFSDYHLAGLHGVTCSSGSLVLALAAADNLRPIEEIYRAAFLDDLWQEQKWGYDAEADKRLAEQKARLAEAHRYLRLLQTDLKHA